MTSNYIKGLNDEVKAYYRVLSPEFPDWLTEYIDTPAMRRLEGTGMNWGSDHTDLYHNKYWYSNLTHSIGVALIVWHYTGDRKQTLAGLFHDIATPTFKHCIDFFRGDYLKQEATEVETSQIISDSPEIMYLLKRDHIKLSQVDNYKLYPIADNDTPKLSADRFEYSYSAGLVLNRVWEIDRIKRTYDDVIVLQNEEGVDELGFQHLPVAEEYISTISQLWPCWVENRHKLTMQFIADALKRMVKQGLLQPSDFYRYSEDEIISRSLNSGDEYLVSRFQRFRKAKRVYSSDTPVMGKYCRSIITKRRYINPLVLSGDGTARRVGDLSAKAKQCLDDYLAYRPGRYAYLDFDFDPDYQLD